jgi:hypothetical protein
MSRIYFVMLILGSFLSSGHGQEERPEHIILITLDGLRWQEVFQGADEKLIRDKRYVRDTSALIQEFWHENELERRAALMPWFWSELVESGVILGNRNFNNKVDLTNDQWFSYPGYNEILTGSADPQIQSNDKIPNPNKTVLEELNENEQFRGKVAAFASWDVFPFIINEGRSGVPVNAGFDSANDEHLTEREIFLNEIQKTTPSPWSSVRLDVFTHHFAKEYLKKYNPRVLYVAYGETDDFAHDSRYDEYLYAARRTDQFIKNLWDYCQSNPLYKNKTAFLITTDHGRGDLVKEEWTSHGTGIKDAHQIWFAAIGKGIKSIGEGKMEGQWYANQVAGTILNLLGIEDKGNKGKTILEIRE